LNSAENKQEKKRGKAETSKPESKKGAEKRGFVGMEEGKTCPKFWWKIGLPPLPSSRDIYSKRR